MKKIVPLITLLVMFLSLSIFADDHEHDENHDNDDHHYYKKKHKKKNRGYINYQSGNNANSNEGKLYQKECSACHFTYQPELLPKRSWKAIMNGLEKHFDADASLEEKEKNDILKYLLENAGDAKYISYKYFRKINKSIYSDQTPIRISEISYFIRKHRKIPKKFIVQDEVKSLSHCQKCHITADKGNYSEHSVKIPNYGRWDD
ncbi:MAG: diheme cytochrome c [Spirochaetota bacterium]|nr:diheme cytochrome c [Spirochaetota bacterium]